VDFSLFPTLSRVPAFLLTTKVPVQDDLTFYFYFSCLFILIFLVFAVHYSFISSIISASLLTKLSCQ
jgi:hypothetical protein